MKKIPVMMSVLLVVMTSAALQFMPQRVPVHYGFSGDIDNWGSKYTYLWLSIGILSVSLIFTAIISGLEKKVRITEDEKLRERITGNLKVTEICGITMVGILFCVQSFMLYKACAESHAGAAYLELDTMKVTAALLSIQMIILANYMPKCKRGGSVGFRLKWTEYNDTTWNKGNRFAAWAMMVSGVFSLVTSILTGGLAATILMLLYLTAAIIVSSVYAHRVYDEEVRRS